MKSVLKLIFYLMPAMASAQTGLGIEGEEVLFITHLIEATTTQLKVQKSLKDHMIRFNEQKKQFLKGGNEKVIGYQMVQSAKNILHLLEKEHLMTIFPKEYLDELTFFSALTKKK